MLWKNLSRREIEVTNDSGVVVYVIDRRPVAAKIPRRDQWQYVCTRRHLDTDTKKMVDAWMLHQPGRIVLVTDKVLEEMLNNDKGSN